MSGSGPAMASGAARARSSPARLGAGGPPPRLKPLRWHGRSGKRRQAHGGGLLVSARPRQCRLAPGAARERRRGARPISASRQRFSKRRTPESRRRSLGGVDAMVEQGDPPQTVNTALYMLLLRRLPAPSEMPMIASRHPRHALIAIQSGDEFRKQGRRTAGADRGTDALYRRRQYAPGRLAAPASSGWCGRSPTSSPSVRRIETRLIAFDLGADRYFALADPT